MTETVKICALRAMLDDKEDDDSVLSVYLNLARVKILNRMYPFKADFTGWDVPDRYVGVQLNISAYLLNKRGAEGQIQHIEGNIHRNYGSSDIPEEMMRDVVPFCQAIR